MGYRRNIPDIEFARGSYRYDPDTGSLTRKKSKGPTRSGTLVTGNSKGRVSFRGRPVTLARLVWFIQTGEWPPTDMIVRRINGVKDDLRWSNLELAAPGSTCRNNPDQTEDDVRSLFTYDPDTGLVRLARDRGGPKPNKAGEEVGHYDSNGYLRTRFLGKVQGVPNLIWLLVNGRLPAPGHVIDHINGIRDDNRLSNLREVTAQVNAKNRRLGHTNETGLHGVRRSGRTTLVWEPTLETTVRAQGYTVDIAGRYIGTYYDFFEACCARKGEEARLGFHENHGNTGVVQQT